MCRHCPDSLSISWICGGGIRTLAKIGVPYFFMISGFFAVDSEHEYWGYDKSIIKRKAGHILKIILGALCFYFLLEVIFFSSVRDVVKIILVPRNICKFLLANSPFIYSHLWFLFALLYCYLFVYVFVRKINTYIIQIYIICAMLLFIILSEILPCFGSKIEVLSSFPIYNIFIFRALPFFLLGSVLKINQEKILNKKLFSISYILIMILGEVIALIERIIFTESQFYLGSFLTCITVFMYCLQYKNSRNHFIEFIGRELTMYIYVSHVAIIKLMDVFFFNNKNNKIYLWIKPLFVIIISILISYLFRWGLLKIKSKKNL